MDICHYISHKGIKGKTLIPGCIGSAARGIDYCTCVYPSKEDKIKHLEKRINKLETIILKLKPMECYIEYLNKDNNFRKTRKDFQTYEEAVKWAKITFEAYNPDFIKFY